MSHHDPQFSDAWVRRIADAVKRVERIPVDVTHAPTAPRPIYYTKLGITTGSISARSGKTPGTGTVQPYTYNGTLLVLSGDVQAVLNWTGSVIASSKWVQFAVVDGKLFLVGNDCSGVAP